MFLRARHAQNRGSADYLDVGLLGPDGQRDVNALHRAQRHIDIGTRHLLEAGLDGFDRVLGRGQIAERILAARACDRCRDGLIGGDVAKGQGHVGDHSARRILDDARDGAVDALPRSGRRDQQQEG